MSFSILKTVFDAPHFKGTEFCLKIDHLNSLKWKLRKKHTIYFQSQINILGGFLY